MVEKPKKTWGSYIQVQAVIKSLARAEDDYQGANQILIWKPNKSLSPKE